MGSILPFASLAHAETLDGVRQDDCRATLVRHGRGIGVPHLHRIVSATLQTPDFVVAHVGDHLAQFRILAEEMLARVRTALLLEVLVLAVDALFHELAQRAVGVARQQWIPTATPQHLDDIPAGAEESGFEFLNNLAVTAYRAIEALQVAVHHEHEVVEFLAHGHGERAHRLGLIHLAVAEEAPHLAVRSRRKPAVFQIPHEACLIDAHQGPKAHRYCRELPEIRHQPRMRVRRQTLAADFLAEVP